MEFGNLFTFSYWFSQPLPAEKEAYWIWVLILLAITAVGFGCLIYKNYIKDKGLSLVLEKASNLGLTIGVIGIMLFFFRQQNIFFLGWRFWFLLWFVGLIIWKARIVRFFLKRVPEIRSEQADRERKEKYLPK